MLHFRHSLLPRRRNNKKSSHETCTTWSASRWTPIIGSSRIPVARTTLMKKFLIAALLSLSLPIEDRCCIGIHVGASAFLDSVLSYSIFNLEEDSFRIGTKRLFWSRWKSTPKEILRWLWFGWKHLMLKQVASKSFPMSDHWEVWRHWSSSNEIRGEEIWQFRL